MTRQFVDHSEKLTKTYAPSWTPPTVSPGEFVNPEHAGILEIVGEVHGHLQDADAYKLYELAYFCEGPILEVGCLHGKSTTIMALAMRAAGRPGPLVSVDISSEHIEIARSNLKRFVPDAPVRFERGKSASVVPSLPEVFSVAFLDGNHRYDAIHADLLATDPRLTEDGLVLLHDYYDSRNQQPEENPRYGVVRAAEELLLPAGYDFCGRFGCCALYRKSPGARPLDQVLRKPEGKMGGLRGTLDRWRQRA